MAGAAGLLCRASGALGIEAVGRASTHWASSFGEPVLRGRWASPYSLGEPVLGEPNEVGRASTKGPLGEPVLIANPYWASQTRLGSQY